MRETYKITIAGLERDLPLYAVNNKLSIAAFILFGDVEITVASATELLKKAPEFDVILTPEAKSIPLAYEMSKQSGKPYIVARKARKVYMGESPISVTDQSITTIGQQALYLGEEDIDKIKGKRVLVVDDVVSTGGSLNAAQQLCKVAGGNEVGACAILAEGDSIGRKDIVYLAELPLFFN